MTGSQNDSKRGKGGLKRWLGGAFVLFIAATLAVGLLSLNSARRISLNSHRVKIEAVHLSHMEKIQSSLNWAVLSAYRSTLAGEAPKEGSALFSQTRQFILEHLEMEEKEGHHRNKESILRLGQSLGESVLALEQIYKQASPRDTISGPMVTRIEEELYRARDLAEQGHHFIYNDIVRLVEDSSRRMSFIMMLFWLFLPASSGFVLLFCLFVGRHLVAPINRLSQAAARIAEGDYQERVPGLARTELAELSQHFNVMALRLQQREEQLAASQERLRKKAQEMSALYSLATEILSLLDLEDILNSVVTKGRQLLDADVAVLCLGSQDQPLHPGAFSGPADALVEPALDCSLQEAHQGLACSCIREEYRQAWLAAPLEEGQLLLGRCQARPFSEEDQEVLQGLALIAAIALKNARLYEEVQTLAVMVERQRISQEMHDSLAQSLALLQMKTKGLIEKAGSLSPERLKESLQQMEREIRRAYDELRLTMAGLRTIAPDGDLLPALKEYIGEFTQKTGLAVALEVVDGGTPDLNPAAQLELIRILQEALTNVWKHSGAVEAFLNFYRQDGMAVVVLADQGRGFDLEKVKQMSWRSLGLKSMKERAQAVGGQLEIITSPGQGTRVVVQIPLATGRGNS